MINAKTLSPPQHSQLRPFMEEAELLEDSELSLF